jgi:hypothetical protein
VEVEAEALFGLEPTLDLGALVGAVVVENEMDVEFRRDSFSNWFRKRVNSLPR